MSRLVRTTLALALAPIVLAVQACGDAEAPTGPGYVQSGEEFWDGWTVPEGTALLGTPFPEPGHSVEGMPAEQFRIGAEFLVVGDPHQVMRDLYRQVEEHGYQPVLDDLDPEVCGGWPWDGTWLCRLYGLADDGHVKFEAHMEINTAETTTQPRDRLWISLGEFADGEAERYGDWTEAEPPQGEAGVQPAGGTMAGLDSGHELKLHDSDESLGAVPEGAGLLADSYNPTANPTATAGFAGIFMVTEADALIDIQQLAARAAAGPQSSDQEITAEGLTAHRMSWDRTVNGCGVTLDIVGFADFDIARLEVDCE